MNSDYQIFEKDCLQWLNNTSATFDLSFVDPPFNQGKDYRCCNDNISEKEYWKWMTSILSAMYNLTSSGGAVYFMQREKNTEYVLQALRKAGWNFQNLIIWKKMTSAVPCSNKFGKHYQIIAYAVKGNKPRLFNRLRIDPPLRPNYKNHRNNGVYVTDVWDDIRELTSGYFAGDEAIRTEEGERFHKQQTPIALLLRIILSSTGVGDCVFDPFAGTGTTLITAYQLNRRSIGTEIDLENVNCIKERLTIPRSADNISKYHPYYIYTENLDKIWYKHNNTEKESQPYFIKHEPASLQMPLFG